MAVYADTESNFNLNDEERRAISMTDLQQMNVKGQL